MSTDEPLPESEDALAEEGGLLDRILEELRAGRRPDPRALGREFPGMEDEAPRLVRLVEFVHGASQAIHPLHDIEARLAAGEKPQLGAFRIHREVARGGMGVVYEAEEIALQRRVALKVLHSGVSLSARELERFRREARTASRLSHPHIVPIFSVGELEGVPYYAMRFVDGHSLAELVRERRAGGARPDRAYFDTVARWGHQVAAALSHAHRSGVVHRDVKPSNVLIDEAGAAWVTDFGLARQVTDETLTISGDLVGTLRYMSPEQARGGSVLDERTDVYSLGATLYELCSLHAPLGGEEREEILRQVLLEEPRPLRSLEPGVPPALATIVHKALSKRAEDRYASTALMAEDLERFRGGREILARPPTAWELVRALDRRNRVLVRGAAIAIVVLVVLTTLISVQALRIASDRNRIAEESDRSLRVQNFLQSVLFYANPKGVDGTSDVDALLDRVAERIGEEFADDPLVESELRFRLGDVYWTRTRLPAAEEQLARAVEIGRRARGPDSEWVLSTGLYYASLLTYLGRAEEAHDVLDQLEFQDSPPADWTPYLLAARAEVHLAAGNREAALEAMETSVAAQRDLLGADHLDVGTALETLASIQAEAGDPDASIESQREASRILAAELGPDAVLALISRCMLASFLANRGGADDLEESEAVLVEALARFRAAPEPSEVDIGWATSLLASTLSVSGRATEADARYREAIDILESRLGPHAQLGQTLSAYGSFLVDQGRYEEAVRILQRSVDMQAELIGPENARTQSARRTLDAALGGLRASDL